METNNQRWMLDAELADKQTEWYRHFHNNPELSMQEYRTTRKIKELLSEMGISLQALSGELGAIGVIEGGGPGPVVVLRADIDALPIEEESELPFRSNVKGISHMCGHDFHTSALLGAGAYLLENRDQWGGTVKLLFQPGEETTEGAKYMLSKGALTGEEKAVFGLHNDPLLEAGTVGVKKGPFFAAADTLHIIVRGLKGHAAMPHLTIDATVAASAIVMGLQTAVSRNVDPLHPAVVTIGSLHSGQGHNVVSHLAEMWGTMRTFSKETRQKLIRIVPRIVEQIGEAYGASIEMEILPQTPAVFNDDRITSEFISYLSANLPQVRVKEVGEVMAAEDFAVYQEKVPGCYFLVGTRDPEKNVIEPWHHPKFKVNESMISLASALLIQAALSQLPKL
ncbi:M20 metallopeptidase family protein [Ferviditalea candida]|uniref:M20 family metallopeptidase n=1 Tax=Ferviditalea candida TaxID=3108399 RepID=A0ABU5ZE83_9BACL|nr:M20 family metallopeptidase [Paenibacillaceae bacterium T2]